MTDSPHEFLNVQELADLLRLSVSAIYRLVARRLIPYHHLPRGLRFHRKDVAAYLERCRVESVSTDYERKKIPH